MNLKPQDIVFLLKLVANSKKNWTFNKLAVELGMSPSEVHAAAQRAVASGLAYKLEGEIHPNIRNLEEFLEHGIRYVFVPKRGVMERGMVTSYVAAPLAQYFPGDYDSPPVWPDPQGEIRGEAFSPLYKSVPEAAKRDAVLYQLLALVDALRGGRARERELAITELKRMFDQYEEGEKP
ncbi:hypothetical protein [Aurantivibrio plasticivorans]